MTGPQIDPRHMITADAFSVSSSVLGLPLASGRRRLVAFAIDGILVGVLGTLDWKILGLLMGFFFFRLATKSSPKAKPQVGMTARAAVGIGRGFRYTIGCLGAVILFVTFIVGTGALGALLQRVTDSDDQLTSAVGNVVAAGLGGQALRTATTEEEAEVAAVELGASALRARSEVTLAEMMETIEGATPEIDMDRAAFMDRVAAQITERVPSARLESSPRASEAMSLDEALAVYRAGVGTSPAEVDQTDSSAVLAAELEAERLEEARSRIAAAVASEELASQEQLVEDLRSDLRRQEQAAAAARQAAEERSGVFAWFVDTLDDLGLTFGWGALYFATLLTWFQGRTPGKRMMGLRVIRLDGEPITLFIAFERAGGYAAGVATGLLGFAQALWDPNRQAIHDKIAGTVVILDGRAPIPGADLTVP